MEWALPDPNTTSAEIFYLQISGEATGKYNMNHDRLRVGGFPVKMLPRNESEQTHQNEYFITQAGESGVEKQELSCKTCHKNCRSAKKENQK